MTTEEHVWTLNVHPLDIARSSYHHIHELREPNQPTVCTTICTSCSNDSLVFPDLWLFHLKIGQATASNPLIMQMSDQASEKAFSEANVSS